MQLVFGIENTNDFGRFAMNITTPREFPFISDLFFLALLLIN